MTEALSAPCDAPDLRRPYCTSAAPSPSETRDTPEPPPGTGLRVIRAQDTEEGKRYRPLRPVLAGLTYERVSDVEAAEVVAKLSRVGKAITTDELCDLRHARRAVAHRVVLVRRRVPVEESGRVWRQDLGLNGLPLDYELREVGEGRAQS